MQKIVFIMVCVFTALILSCGNSETESCVTAFDCPDGKICSDGMCVDKDTSSGNSEENNGTGDDVSDGGNELPDGGSSLPGGDSNDSDSSTSDTPETPDSPETPDVPNGDDNDIPENPDTPNDNDAETPENPDTLNDNDTETPENPDTLNDNDTETPENPDTLNDNDTETPDTPNDNDTETPENPDTLNDNDTETPENPDTTNDDDADAVDDSDSETNEGDPYSDWDSTPDDEVCPFVMSECSSPITDFGCLPAMENEYPDYCDGLDNDCDGKVDEGCFCDVGETQACFKGKPNQRNVGICHDGVQTCVVGSDGKTGVWGDCTGGISPKQDVCDNADNDCNGCVDDDLCCNPPINCAYDIGSAIPFTDKIINGNQIYDSSHLFNDAATATWTWTLTKGPCDIVLNKTSFTTKGATTEAGLAGDGAASTVVSGTGLSWFKVNFQLSGSYTLHLKVTRTNGEVYECDWIIRVISDGLRIELCWDKTGSHSSGGYDLDLHLGKNGATADVYGTCNDYTGWTEDTACSYLNCRNDDEWNVSGWGYGTTASGRNPRLDIDNISDAGKPENINVDNPNNGDTFRVLVRMYPWDDYSSSAGTHPVVNVYCGGTLRATYGVSPQYTLSSGDDSWKVVQVKWVGDVGSDECQLTPNLGIVSSSVPFYDNW